MSSDQHARSFRPWRLARGAALLAGMLVAAAGAVSAADITVDDGRPVGAAVDAIQKLTGRAIGYEDPLYLNKRATVDVTAQVARVAGSVRTIVPRHGTLSFTPPADASPAAVAAAVEAMVAAYNAGPDRPASFTMSQDGKFIWVAPSKALAASGRLAKITPVLDTRIRLAAKPRTGLALLEEIAHAVSAASHVAVEIGIAPMNAMANQRIAIGAANEPARAVLEKLIAANPTPLSWRLLYDAGLRTYYLSLVVVAQPGEAP